MKSILISALAIMLLATLGSSYASAEEQYIRRAAVTGRSGPGTFFDAVIVLKRGRAVTVTETLKRWAKVTAGKHKVWIPTNGLAKVPAKTYKAVDKIDSGDVSSSPAGLAAAAKGFASKFAKRVKATEINTLTAARMSPKAFSQGLKRFHATHPTRRWSFRNEARRAPELEGFEDKLGLAVAAKLVAHYGLVNAPKEARSLTLLANIIGVQSARYDIPWKVFVLDSDDMNAFGLMGGYILVTRGLLAACDGVEERAAVLAHEIAHVVRYHNISELKERRVYLQADAAQEAMNSAFGDAPDPDVALLNATALEAYTFLHKDRLEAHEYEADHLAAVYLHRVGLSAKALVKLLIKVKTGRGEVEAYSGHPSFASRIERLKGHVRAMR